MNGNPRTRKYGGNRNFTARFLRYRWLHGTDTLPVMVRPYTVVYGYGTQPYVGLDPNSNINVNNIKCSPLPLPPQQHPQRQRRSLPAPSFVVVSVLSSRQQTPVANCTLNSTYTAKDATFDFSIYLSLTDKLSVVELVVWDKDMLLKEYLGEVALPLDDWFLDMVSSKLGAVNFCLLFFFFFFHF